MKRVYLIAVVFALIAGFATYLFANEIEKNSSFSDAAKVSVVEAITEVPANTTITADNFATYFTVNDVISSYVLDGAVNDEDGALDTVTRVDLYPGEQVTTYKLITADSDDATLSLTIPDGYVAYSIDAAGTSAGDGYFAVGDHVDVYVYRDNKTSVPLKNLQVFKVASKATNATAEQDQTDINEYSTLTLIVTEAQAQQLFNIEKQGNYKLVLKPRVASAKESNTNQQ